MDSEDFLRIYLDTRKSLIPADGDLESMEDDDVRDVSDAIDGLEPPKRMIDESRRRSLERLAMNRLSLT